MDHNVPGILLFYHPCDTVDGQAITNNYEDSYETLCIENVFSFFLWDKKPKTISCDSHRSWPALREKRLRYWHSRSGELMLSMAGLEFPWENGGFPWISPCEWVNGLWIFTSIHLKMCVSWENPYICWDFPARLPSEGMKKRCNQNWWVDGGRNAIFLWTWILDILASCVMSPLKLKAPDSAKDHITWYNKLEIILAPTQSVFLRRSKYQTRIVPKIYLEPIFIATFNGKLTISGPFVFRVHLQKTRRHDNDDFLVATPPRYRAEFSPALRGGAKLLLLALRLSWTAEAEAGLVKNWILQIFEEQDHGMDK